MEQISPEDKEGIANAIQRTVAISTLRRIRNLILQEQKEAEAYKRISSVLGGVILGLLFSTVFIYRFFVRGFAATFLSYASFRDLFSSMLVSANLAILPLAFSAYFLFRYRYSMLTCLGIGALVALAICAARAGYQVYIIS